MALYRNISGFLHDGSYQSFSEDLDGFGAFVSDTTSLRTVTPAPAIVADPTTPNITTLFRAPDAVIQPVLTSPVSPAVPDDTVAPVADITTLFRLPDDAIQPVLTSPFSPSPDITGPTIAYTSDVPVGTTTGTVTPGGMPVLVDPIIPAPNTGTQLPVLQHPDVTQLNNQPATVDWLPVLTLGGLVLTMLTGEQLFKNKRKLALVAGLGVLYLGMSKK